MSTSSPSTPGDRWVLAGSGLTAVAMLGYFLAQLAQGDLSLSSSTVIPLVLGVVSLAVCLWQYVLRVRSGKN
ncbi:hypothetical protein [Streptomyces althioticus]|uniref:hypothetical protein n=1 Tax=Streptomyces althioticus TaxID=83380 RepID=UPI0037F38CD6